MTTSEKRPVSSPLVSVNDYCSSDPKAINDMNDETLNVTDKPSYYSYYSPRGISVQWLKHEFLEEILKSKVLKNCGENNLQASIFLLEERGIFHMKGKNICCPEDGKVGASFVDSLLDENSDYNLKDDNELDKKDQLNVQQKVVGTATHYLSYDSSSSIGEIVDALENFCFSSALDPKHCFVWIYSFCTNPHRRKQTHEQFTTNKLRATSLDIKVENTPQNYTLKSLKQHVNSIGHVLTLLSPWYKPNFVKRTWCVYELFLALNDKDCTVTVITPSREKDDMVKTLLNAVLHYDSPASPQQIRIDEGKLPGSEMSKINVLYQTLDIKIQETMSSKDTDRIRILHHIMNLSGFNKLDKEVTSFLIQWQTNQVLEIVQAYQKNETDTLRFSALLNHIAGILSRTEELDIAADLYRKVYAIEESSLGLYHLKTAETCSNLGEVLQRKGEYDSSYMEMKKSEKVRESILGVGNPTTIASCISIANLMVAKGDLNGAYVEFRKILSIRISSLPEDHPDIATSYIDLADILFMRNDYDGAEEKYQNALAILQNMKVDQSLRIAKIRYELGTILSEKNDFDGALGAFYKSLTIYEKFVKFNDPKIVDCYNKIGLMLSHTGNMDEALEQLKYALTIQQESLGDDHIDLTTTLNNLGTVLIRKADYEKALQYYRKALVIHISIHGTYSLATAQSHCNIGRAMKFQGKFDEALASFRKCLAIRSSCLGDSNLETARTYNMVGIVLKSMGDLDNALVQYRKALVIQESLLDIHHPDIAASHNNVGRALFMKGDLDGALVHCSKALTIIRSIMGNNHPNTVSSVCTIGAILKQKGDFADSLVEYKKALSIQEVSLGTEHADTLRTRALVDALNEAVRDSRSGWRDKAKLWVHGGLM